MCPTVAVRSRASLYYRIILPVTTGVYSKNIPFDMEPRIYVSYALGLVIALLAILAVSDWKEGR